MIQTAREFVRIAYKKLKQTVYYDKSQLVLRKRLAEFECSVEFEQRLEVVARVISSDAAARSKEFLEWLEEINFDLVPKGVEGRSKSEKDAGTFVTNLTSAKKYTVKKVNYLFNGPIELHLLDVLWLMTEGKEYDQILSAHSMGSRLHDFVGKDDDRSAYLFKKYHELYSKWRDDGIKTARHMLTEKGQSVCMLGLDIQEYYYRIRVNWTELRDQVNRAYSTDTLVRQFEQREIIGGGLFDCVEAICRKYHQKVKSLLIFTHDDLPSEATCLPIGLCSSPVIANWYLKGFDNAVLSKIRPAYYGRYIDDIFLVIASETPPKENGDQIENLMDSLLVDAGVLKKDTVERYELCERPGLYLQRKKCILQYFDAKHSIAGLEKFQKQIDDNASDFALLPLENDESPVAQVAYELLYDGSVNKFRSVKGIGENRWELARHLSKQTQLHLLTEGKLDSETKTELFRFFKGYNAIEYWDMWERVISFLLIAENQAAAKEFYEAMKREIIKTHFKETRKITTRLRETLLKHLDLCLELSVAVKNDDAFAGLITNVWRDSNLIRHHLVAVPLLNYTDFDGDLAVHWDTMDKSIDERKIVFSPRYVHFDECLSFVDSGCDVGSDEDSVSRASKLFSKFHGSEFVDVQCEDIQIKEEGDK
jgi:hypothetical protein